MNKVKFVAGHSSKKHMAIESAAPFKSDKPFCIMAMKSWNVNEPYMLVRSNSLLYLVICVFRFKLGAEG